jgi:hypothetical protein
MQVRAFDCLPTTARLLHAVKMRRRDDVVHAEIIDEYVAHGGVASPDEIITLMRPHWRQPISILARWIFGRKVVSFSWRMQMLLPVFQFAQPRMTPNQAIADCSLEFGELMDDDGFAAWFVRPCMWLDRKMPVDLLPDDPDAVVDAASKTRFALMGRRSVESVSDTFGALRIDSSVNDSESN